jgi:hypothetical protein
VGSRAGLGLLFLLGPMFSLALTSGAWPSPTGVDIEPKTDKLRLVAPWESPL